VEVIGTITTWADGSFAGLVRKSGGAPFAFPRNSRVAGQFVLYSGGPGSHPNFVTGIDARVRHLAFSSTLRWYHAQLACVQSLVTRLPFQSKRAVLSSAETAVSS